MVRGNFGNQSSRVHPSELNKSSAILQCFLAQRLTYAYVGLVLVFSLRDGKLMESDKVCESEVPLFSTKLFFFTQMYMLYVTLCDFYGPFFAVLGLVTHFFLTNGEGMRDQP